MAKKKYYAVKRGKTPGIYLTWEDCKNQTEGFSGAVYKGFSDIEQAELFLMGTEAVASEDPMEQDGEREWSDYKNLPADEAVAYVDGSYNESTNEYSCGVVLFCQGQEIHISKKGEDPELAAMRNVAGELLGAEVAMRESVERKIRHLTIYHDYQGIASWCLGEWKTNKEGTMAYKRYYDSLRGTLSVSFEKVKGHSGNRWNDLADSLAKQVIF